MRKKEPLKLLEQRRMIAANMFERDMRPVDIAVFVGADVQTVRLWRRQFKAGGRKALEMKKAPGAKRKLTQEQRAQLLEMLKLEPKSHGLDAYLWTTKLVVRLIREKFNIEHHHDHVRVILRDMGLTPQKPARRARERDEAKITEFREKTWVDIKKK